MATDMNGLTLTFAVLVLAAITSTTAEPHIWTITIGHEWGGHEYFDDAGYLTGFGISLIDLVCTSGDMDCRIVRDNYVNCWNHGDPGERATGGVGLMSGWYDACTAWVSTLDRIHTFQFSIPYLNYVGSRFFVLKGHKDAFDSTDLQHKRIAFIDGWSSDPQCIVRQTTIANNHLSAHQILLYSYPKDIFAGLKSQQADAVFTTTNTWTVDQLSQLDMTDNSYQCYLSGNGMMSRKDSGFTAMWNIGFNKLRDGQKFNKFCEKQNKLHGHKGESNCITF